MDDTATTTIKTKTNDNKSRKRRWSEGDDEQSKCEDYDDLEEEKQCDVEIWETLSRSFRQVQSVLDQNRALIQQANDNHRSRVPDSLSKNVVLIRDINSNINQSPLHLLRFIGQFLEHRSHAPRQKQQERRRQRQQHKQLEIGSGKIGRGVAVISNTLLTKAAGLLVCIIIHPADTMRIVGNKTITLPMEA
ncbi:protein EARLY FLOWERING 4-like [Prunus yedoensis var. nudiflora]|uniref:Protein EARLY FLOWERING 4-like n=1 Tax=Prunus yedoensis var. nudiflora TaxID=2094558 RepID=A0A314Z5M5_PRUYE|nr:protein EARLY FLOWERING 4-like [Prunus yedoensis var. nudiflora]